MTGTPAEPQRGTRTPARPRPPLRPSSQGSRWPAVAGCGGGSSGGGTFSPGRGVSAVVTGGIAVCGGTGAPGTAPSAPGRRARLCVAPSTWGNTAASEAPLSVVPPLASRGCTRTLTARAPCRARLHLAPFGGGASGDSVGVARPLGGPSEWETGEYLAGTGQMESTGSRGQPGLSCRQQEASLEQPRAPRAGSAGQTPVPVGSRGASPARGRGCGIVTHGGWGTGSRAGWQLPLLRLFQPRRGRDRVAPGAAPHPHPIPTALGLPGPHPCMAAVPSSPPPVGRLSLGCGGCSDGRRPVSRRGRRRSAGGIRGSLESHFHINGRMKPITSITDIDHESHSWKHPQEGPALQGGSQTPRPKWPDARGNRVPSCRQLTGVATSTAQPRPRDAGSQQAALASALTLGPLGGFRGPGPSTPTHGLPRHLLPDLQAGRRPAGLHTGRGPGRQAASRGTRRFCAQAHPPKAPVLPLVGLGPVTGPAPGPWTAFAE